MKHISILDQPLILDALRAIYYPEFCCLIVSDMHIGKSAHFRKHGLQIPQAVAETDLYRLDALILKYKPQHLLVTGDMFHHDLNLEIANFKMWRNKYPQLKISLIQGNHDRLTSSLYNNLGISLIPESLNVGPFCLLHNIEDFKAQNKYAIAGHLHPGVNLKGKAKQQLRLPCYYFGAKYAIMPAFSLFTGLSQIPIYQGDQVFAIAEKEIISL